MQNFKDLSDDKDLFWTYYDDTPKLRGCKDGFTEEKVAKLVEARKHRKQLPFCSVSNMIDIMDTDKVIEYISDDAGADFRALYWTDLHRIPLEIPYHSFFDEENKKWKCISYIVKDGVILSSREEDEDIRDTYYDKDYIKSNLITKFTDTNMLHLQVAFINVSIRKIDANKYVVIETMHNGGPSNKIIPE